MQETENEIRSYYENVDRKAINVKIRESMLTIVRMEKNEDGFTLYKQVMETFTKDEMAHIVCTYIAKDMNDKLKSDPEFLSLVKMIRLLERAGQKLSKEDFNNLNKSL